MWTNSDYAVSRSRSVFSCLEAIRESCCCVAAVSMVQLVTSKTCVCCQAESCAMLNLRWGDRVRCLSLNKFNLDDYHQVKSLANSRASRLCVHPFDPLSAPGGSHEWIRKVLCFPRNLDAREFHDAHGIGRLAVICQDEFGDPKITAANDPSDSKPLFARLTGALVLYVASTAGS